MLIVEDESLVALILEDMFLANGYDVVGVADREHDALAIARATPPDIAVVDVRLAGGDDGIALGAKLQELGPPMLVLFATANPEEVHRRAEAGYGCLAKPFEPDTLLRLIDTIRAGSEPALPGFRRLRT